MRQDILAACPKKEHGLLGMWPQYHGQAIYCAFRNPSLNPSVHGGDAVCSVETVGGRRKVSPKDLIQCQRMMRANLVAAPAEEVPCDVTGHRRLNRAVTKAADWLKEILELKAADPELSSFDWHILAGIQGGGDLRQRKKAAESAASFPAAGFWIGGLGYKESLEERARVLDAVTTSLPTQLPRFLPLGSGSPLEVLQAVLLGVDILEIGYPVDAATEGLALTFDWDAPLESMPGDGAEIEELLRPLLPQPDSETATSLRPVRQLQVRAADCREDFGPISEASPVKQYSRAYLFHLFQVRELLGTMLLTQHNLHAYSGLFTAIRKHILGGTLRRYAAWFIQTQTGDSPADPVPNQTAKRRKT